MSSRRSLLRRVLALGVLGASALAQSPTAVLSDPLLDGFKQPPQSARPLAWWHWMNGNISKEGIRADLQWMHRVGLGGVQVFDAALATPQVVDHRIEYMTPEWKDAFRYATDLCNQFGLQLAIAGSPGWSETGGPWVTGRQAMKKYVWSETVVEGGKKFHGVLAHPPTVTGRFQNTPIAHPPIAEPEFYTDAAAVAFKQPADETGLPVPQITTSDGPVDETQALSDGNLGTSIPLHRRDGTSAWVQARFAMPVTLRALTASLGENEHGAATEVELATSDDGRTFRPITSAVMEDAAEQTISFAPVTAQIWRMTLKGQPAPNEDIALNEFTWHSGARVREFEAKAGFRTAPDLYDFPTPMTGGAGTVSEKEVIDLTGKLQPDGTLDWDVPPGRWIVLRLGYSLLGTTNHPATKEATGLEVDKLDRRYVKSYMETYLDSYRDTVGAANMGRRGIQYVTTDSWEAGTQNWTDKMISQFRARRGYDPTPWLPVLAGYVVQSGEASDRFLWDFRKTIADLTAEEHYGQVQASLASRNMGHYGESHESGRAFIGDGMEVKKLDDVPMGAMWTQSLGVNKPMYTFNADDRESASVAHIYGQNLAAAESMTAKYDPFGWSPATLKPTADQEFLNGINRIVIHESTHQPLMDWKPGLTLGIYGQWFNRNETWADQARPWIDYLARNSFMLQQGHFVADILYFYGEDTNLTSIFRYKSPNVPEGYGFDYINADGLIHQIQTENGTLTTKSGMRYSLLVLDPFSQHMSLPVLRAIDSLVRAGATVAGPKPVGTPSLADDAVAFDRLATELFGDGHGTRTVGRGKVFAGADAADAVREMRREPDFTFIHTRPDQHVEFIHRRMSDTEIYFVDNRSDEDVALQASFRVSGKVPELWHPETGATEPLSYRTAQDDTSVPLHLSAWGSAFVVFRHRATASSAIVPETGLATATSLDGSWEVAFQAGRGAPASTTFPHLISWPESTISGVRFFSGTATYTKTFHVEGKSLTSDSRVWLDLGDVKNLASISVNGRDLGTVWHTPFRVDVTSALRAGENTLTVRVTNAWVNRLIGDQQPNATQYTHTDFTPYRADSPLLPSGLLGPVQLLRTSRP